MSISAFSDEQVREKKRQWTHDAFAWKARAGHVLRAFPIDSLSIDLLAGESRAA